MSHVLVTNLPNNVRVRELETLFSKFGEILDIRITTYASHGVRASAMIAFKGKEDAQRCVVDSTNTFLGEYHLGVDVIVDC